MFAQSIVEYGALASAKATLQSIGYSFRDWVGQITPTTWAVIGGIALALVVLRRRGRSR